MKFSECDSFDYLVFLESIIVYFLADIWVNTIKKIYHLKTSLQVKWCLLLTFFFLVQVSNSLTPVFDSTNQILTWFVIQRKEVESV